MVAIAVVAGLLVGLHASASAAPLASACMGRRAGTIAFERILFLAAESGSEMGDVWVVKADGSGERNLTGGDRVVKDGRPAWSPDGRQIAFMSYRGGGGIFVMNRAGRHIGRLTREEGWDPTWSPDGRRIAFGGSNGPSGPSARIGVVAARGGSIRWLTRRGLEVSGPDWSPAGEIAFIRRTGWTEETLEVFAMSGDGGRQRRLTRDRSSDAGPAWSPNGNEIAYSSENGISIMEPGRGGTRKLTHNPNDYAPEWSPDGRCIAFSRNGTIYVVGVNGEPPRKLMTHPRHGALGAIDTAPDWTAR